MKTFRIAAIPGDGIGTEVVPEGIRVLEAAEKKFGFGLEWTPFDWSCERFSKTGKMMPDDGLEQLRRFDAIFLGAVGQAGRGRPCFAVGIADPDPAQLSSVCEFAAGASAPRVSKSR